MTKFVIVPGTWEFDGDDKLNEWWNIDSPFVQFAAQHGFERILVDGEPFVWNTGLGGIDPFRYFGKKTKHTDWKAGARQLKVYLRDVPLDQRNIIAHSHGGQVLAYAAAEGLELNHVITLAMPVRGDMDDVYTKAAMNISSWTHVHSDKSDWMQLFGSVFDGRFGIHRNCKQADFNIMIPHIGHSGIVKNPEQFHVWLEVGLFEYLRH